MENRRVINEDEIDLRELFVTLWKKKWFIGFFTLIVTILAIVYAYMKTPIYEVKSNIRVGYIGAGLIENPDIIVKMLSVVFHVEDKITKREEVTAEVTSIATNKKLKDFIELKTQATSNKEALQKNKEVVSFLQNYYQPKIDEYLRDKKNSITDAQNDLIAVDAFERKNIENQIKISKTQNIVEIDEKIEFLVKKKVPLLENKIEFYQTNLDEYIKEIKQLNSQNKNITEATIISIQMVNYQNLILDARNTIGDLTIQILDIQNNQVPKLQREKENIISDILRKLEYKRDVELKSKKIKIQERIEKLKYEISSQNIQNSLVVGEYITKDAPIKPKKKLIVVVAFVTGFILSIFLVFFLEFIKGIKKQDD